MRQMKDSGIEWIGEIPESWNVDKVKYCSNLDSSKLSEHTDPEYEFNYIDISSVTEYGGIGETTVMTFDKSPSRARMVVNNGDTIISTVRTYLKAIAYIDGLNDHICSTGFCVVTPNKKLNPKFGYYLMQSDYFVQRIVSQSVGVSYPAISSAEIGNMPIIIPSIREQSRIADYLDKKCAEIDAIIAAKEKTNELLKERRQSIIYEAVTKGLDPTVPMKDSGIEWIGEIPERWEVKKIKHIGNYRNGLTYSPNDIVGETDGTLVLRSSNIQNGRLVFDDNVFVSCNIPEQLKVHKGDILICSRNGSRELIGKNAIIDVDDDLSFGAFMMIFRCHTPKYMSYILNSNIFTYYLSTFLTATVNQLTGENFGNMKIVYCSDEQEQKNLVEFLDKKCKEIDILISSNNSTIEKLKEYRQSVIYEAVTGKVEI